MKLLAVLTVILSASLAMASDSFKTIKADDLAKMIETSKDTTFVYDANTDDVRKKEGMIPGATVLASSSSYSTSVLPPNKEAKLVFYCASTQCTASHDAAKLAIKAGYKDVYVMSDGIRGWKKAGKPSAKYDKAS